MNVGDVIEIVSKGHTGVGAMLNVYHMEVDEMDVPGSSALFAPDGMDGLLALNFELLIEDVQPWAPAEVRWDGIDVRNLFNPAELNSASYSPAEVGANATHYAAAFVNPRITSTRKLYGMHGGRKALAPCSEAVTGNNGVGGGLLTSLGVLVGKWNAAQHLVPTDVGLVGLRSVVVKRIFVPAVPGVHKAYYRLPENTGEAVMYIANNWKVEQTLGSQNTRKTGRGS